VLKQYNNSDLYALYIGHLADRFSGAPSFAAEWGKVASFNRGEVKAMQEKLKAEGYTVSINNAEPDGLIGYRTRVAIGLSQAKAGRAATCLPDAALIRSVR
jgi:hypothetical protein